MPHRSLSRGSPAIPRWIGTATSWTLLALALLACNPDDSAVREPSSTCGGEGRAVEHLDPTRDLDAVVNGDPPGSATTFCLSAGTYAVDRTVTPRSGDRIVGPEGEVARRGPASYAKNGPSAKVVGTDNLNVIMRPTGTNIVLRWIDVSNAVANLTGSTPVNGQGVGISAGRADGTLLMEFLRVHDTDASGVGSAKGRIFNSEFFDNTRNPAFLGHSGAAIKGITEFEAARLYIHDNQGNGLWCDYGCRDDPARKNGFWAHENLIVDNGRYGVRYEFSPMVPAGVRSPQPTALVEDNEIHANGYAGTAMQDAQNGVFRQNDFGAETIAGVHYGQNGGAGSDGGRAMQFSEGARGTRTDLWDAVARDNSLGGESVQGCDEPNAIVLCENNG